MNDFEYFGTYAAFAVGIIALFWLVVKLRKLHAKWKRQATLSRAKTYYKKGGKPQMKARPEDAWFQVSARRKK